MEDGNIVENGMKKVWKIGGNNMELGNGMEIAWK